MIYVDQIQYYPKTSLHYKHWCHMATDGDIEELHAFAKRIGLKRTWFQNKVGHPHYDLVPTKRLKAIHLGAITVSDRRLIEVCYPEWLASFEKAFGPRIEEVLGRKLEGE